MITDDQRRNILSAFGISNAVAENVIKNPTVEYYSDTPPIGGIEDKELYNKMVKIGYTPEKAKEKMVKVQSIAEMRRPLNEPLEFTKGLMKSGVEMVTSVADLGLQIADTATSPEKRLAIARGAKAQGITTEEFEKKIKEAHPMATAIGEFPREFVKTGYELSESDNDIQGTGKLVGNIAALLVPTSKASLALKGESLLTRVAGEGLVGAGTEYLIGGKDREKDALYGLAGGVGGELLSPVFSTALKKTKSLKDIFKGKAGKAGKVEGVADGVVGDIELGVSRRKAEKASNQILQIGNKADELMREEEFSKATQQFAKVIGESDDKIATFQDAVVFTNRKLKTIKEEVAKEIEPFAIKEVDHLDYLSDLRNRVDELKKSSFTEKNAVEYETVLHEAVQDLTGLSKKEIEEIGLDSALSLSKKKTVKDMLKLNKDFNKAVKEIHTAGGKKDLNPEQKVRLQALELLREGSRRQIINNTSKRVGELNLQRSGLIEAKNRLKIQRGRANKALDEIDWTEFKLANWKERASIIKEYAPWVKDLGKGKLQMLDSKSKLLEEMLDLNVRRIRANYAPQSINIVPKISNDISQSAEEIGTKGSQEPVKQVGDLGQKESLNNSSRETIAQKRNIANKAELLINSRRIYKESAKKWRETFGKTFPITEEQFLKKFVDGADISDVKSFVKTRAGDFSYKLNEKMEQEMNRLLGQDFAKVAKEEIDDEITAIATKGGILNLARSGGFVGKSSRRAFDFIEKHDSAKFESKLDNIAKRLGISHDEILEKIKETFLEKVGKRTSKKAEKLGNMDEVFSKDGLGNLKSEME